MLKFLVLAFLAFSFPSLGQKDPCLSSDLKYKKLLTKAISQENYENQTNKLSALISKYPNYAETYFTYARLTMRESEIKSTNEQTFQKSKELKKTALLYYNFTINKCPKYHAECYYTIGSSLIEDGDYKNGITYFKKFIEFNESDFPSIPKDLITASIIYSLLNFIRGLGTLLFGNLLPRPAIGIKIFIIIFYHL